MGLVEKIANRAGLMVERSGSLRLIQSADALAFLDQCEAEGFRVLGIEGFARKQGALIPDMDAIADFSDAPGCSILEAKRFVTEVHASSLMLDFAVSECRLAFDLLDAALSASFHALSRTPGPATCSASCHPAWRESGGDLH